MNIQDLPDSAPRSSDEIQSGIRDTRQRMDETLDELSQRLTPRSLLNSAMDWWDENSSNIAGKSRVEKTYRMVSHQVKKHPAPSLLIGAGLVWLFLNSDEEDSHPASSPERHRPQEKPADGPKNGASLTDKIADKASEAGEVVSGAVDSIRQKTHDLVEGANEVGGKARELYTSGQQTVKDKLGSGMERLQDAVDDYPLAVGAAFLALGALAGVILPPTRREDSLLGQKSDEIVGEIREKGENLLEQGKEKASAMGDGLLEKARDHGITAESVGDKLSGLTAEAGEAVRQATGEVAATLQGSSPPEQVRQPDPFQSGG
jgi:ElaB/YqjD/DUF883 family membrane-anchored ribosome-binding protein